MAKRGISMMAEQQRLRTVSGGLESLSVWDDSETDRRFRRLETRDRRRRHVRSEKLKLDHRETTNATFGWLDLSESQENVDFKLF